MTRIGFMWWAVDADSTTLAGTAMNALGTYRSLPRVGHPEWAEATALIGAGRDRHRRPSELGDEPDEPARITSLAITGGYRYLPPYVCIQT